MLYTIENDALRVAVESMGAQLKNVSAGGREYLWQGSPAIWNGRAPNLFPYVGRLTGDAYTLEGRTYHMPHHGFAKLTDFALGERRSDAVTLTMSDTEETRAMWPYAFSFSVTFALAGPPWPSPTGWRTGTDGSCASAWGPTLASTYLWRRERRLPTTALPSLSPAGPTGWSCPPPI